MTDIPDKRYFRPDEVASGENADPVRLITRIRNNRLLLIMERSGLTVKEFAAKLGISTSLCYDLLSLSKYPTEKIALQISAKVGVPADELFPDYLKNIKHRVVIKTVSEPQMLALKAAEHLCLPASQEDKILNNELAEAINSILDMLTPRQRKIIELRYGLNGHDEHTLEEIGNRFSVSRETIRYIEARVLRKMRGFPMKSAFLDFIKKDADNVETVEESK